MKNIKNIVESLLFVAETPLTFEQIRQAIPESDTSNLRRAIEILRVEYAERMGGFFLHEVAGGYQFRTRSEYKEYIRRLVQPTAPRLSKAAMETLAIIAYRQPILRSEIEYIRGVNSGNTIRILLERKLIRILGRKEVPGRPLVYATTPKFLETFDLQDLKDLPTPKDMEGIGTISDESSQIDDVVRPADKASLPDQENNS